MKKNLFVTSIPRMLLRSYKKQIPIKHIVLQILLNIPNGKFAQKHVSLRNSIRVHRNGTNAVMTPSSSMHISL